MSVVVRALVLTVLLCASSWAAATPSPTDLSVIVCGPQFMDGVSYVVAPGVGFVQCGLDTNGDELVLLRANVTLAQLQGASTPPDASGVAAGVAIGGAVFGVMAVAFGFRVLRNFLNSSSEG